MTRTGHFLRVAMMTGVVLTLGACETMDQTMETMKTKAGEVRERIAAMDFSVPEIQTSEAAMKTDQEENIPPVNQDSFAADINERVEYDNRDDGSGTVSINSAPQSYSEHDPFSVLNEPAIAYTDRVQNGAPVEAPQAVTQQNLGYQCPKTHVVDDLASYHQFENQTRPRPDEKISELSFGDVTSTCTRNANNLVVEITMNFKGALGPLAQAKYASDRPSFAYPYFIAVTSSNGTIISKEVFDINVTYEKGETWLAREEVIRHVAPIAEDSLNGNYELMIGFQLGEAELAYNRSLLPAGKRTVSLPPSQYTAPASAKQATAAPERITPPEPQQKPPVPVKQQAAVKPQPQPVPAPAPVIAEPEEIVRETVPAAGDEDIVEESVTQEEIIEETVDAVTETAPDGMDAESLPPEVTMPPTDDLEQILEDEGLPPAQEIEMPMLPRDNAEEEQPEPEVEDITAP